MIAMRISVEITSSTMRNHLRLIEKNHLLLKIQDGRKIFSEKLI